MQLRHKLFTRLCDADMWRLQRLQKQWGITPSETVRKLVNAGLTYCGTRV